ncbi:hypothetical protein Q3G72_027745 [Acer saccharum]|nr:hypothetical protein Q3G72_027745 [Acer saccharum]
MKPVSRPMCLEVEMKLLTRNLLRKPRGEKETTAANKEQQASEGPTQPKHQKPPRKQRSKAKNQQQATPQQRPKNRKPKPKRTAETQQKAEQNRDCRGLNESSKKGDRPACNLEHEELDILQHPKASSLLATNEPIFLNPTILTRLPPT